VTVRISFQILVITSSNAIRQSPRHISTHLRPAVPRARLLTFAAETFPQYSKAIVEVIEQGCNRLFNLDIGQLARGTPFATARSRRGWRFIDGSRRYL
jgi:hypothetical protein